MTNEQHNKCLGIAFLVVYGGYQFLWMLAMSLMFFFLPQAIPDRPGRPNLPPEFFLLFSGFALVFQFIITVQPLVTGYALLKRKSWARLAGIIGGILAAMSFPIGTVVCVYALWFMLGDGWKEIYQRNAGQPSSARQEFPSGAHAPWWGDQGRSVERERVPPSQPPHWR